MSDEVKNEYVFETNLNDKLHSPKFIHLEWLPKPASAEEKVFNVWACKTKDESAFPFRGTIIDLKVVKLNEVSDALTWCSHGMMARIFRQWFRLKYRLKEDANPDIGIYFWMKTDSQLYVLDATENHAAIEPAERLPEEKKPLFV